MTLGFNSSSLEAVAFPATAGLSASVGGNALKSNQAGLSFPTGSSSTAFASFSAWVFGCSSS
eukprot:4641793-Pyramimonas_sp.AAC.1